MDNLQERIEEACNILNGAKNPMTAMVGANGGKQLMEVSSSSATCRRGLGS